MLRHNPLKSSPHNRCILLVPLRKSFLRKRVIRVVLLQNKWRVKGVELPITHYPFSWTYWQAMDWKLELNLTGTSHCHYQARNTQSRNTYRLWLCAYKREDFLVFVIVSVGSSAVHTMPLIPGPVHLSCRLFLSGWAKTFYLNLLRVPLKCLCYCSEPSCVCVTWESSAAWPSPNTLVLYICTHT